MISFLTLCFGTLVRLFRARRSLLLENLALRQQPPVFKCRHARPSLGSFHRLFRVTALRVWSGWKKCLIIVTPETAVRWHRAGFRLYWRFISRVRKRVGKEQTPQEVRCRGTELNRRRQPFQGCALPPELPRHHAVILGLI